MPNDLIYPFQVLKERKYDYLNLTNLYNNSYIMTVHELSLIFAKMICNNGSD